MSNEPTLSRFMRKVAIDASGCWLWTATKNQSGYGHFGMGTARSERAHRVSYKLHCGAIPDGMQVLHRCDNPSCVNPEHLFLGTRRDNMRDMASKGRCCRQKNPHLAQGEKSNWAKLQSSQVLDICKLLSMNKTKTEVARQFNVSRKCVSAIATGKSWSHLTQFFKAALVAAKATNNGKDGN